jgi:hypothetical protein
MRVLSPFVSTGNPAARVEHPERGAECPESERYVSQVCPLEPDEMAVVLLLKISVAYITNKLLISPENARESGGSE